MTAILDGPVTSPVSESSLLKQSWKTSIALGIFAVLGFLLLVVFGRGGLATFNFTASQADAVQLAQWVIPARGTDIAVAILGVLLAVGSGLLTRADRKTPLWYISIFAVLLIFGFLVWASTDTGHVLHFTDMLVLALGLSAPLIFGGLGGVISERVGVTNVAIEGQLLSGAFVSALAASITQNVVVGLAAAAVAGMLVSFVLGAFAVKYAVNQVIVGIVLNVLVVGLTTFLYQTVMLPNIETLNSPPQLHEIDIPLLSQIPVVGPLLFSQTIIVYLMYVAIIAVTIGLFRTRWGLRVRAVGEHPQAADTVGINVARTRFWNVALAGGIVGLGGAFYTIGQVGAFSSDVTNGAGYIALAAVIFGGWNPIRVTLAALLFGFTSELQSVLGILGSPVPNDFLLMLPYVVTIISVAGLVGRVRGPAAAGRPYIKS
jgi:general nucleoside transport system permease protein